MGSSVDVSRNGKGVKILVNQTSFLGDVLLTTPLLAELRRRFPEAVLELLCTPRAAGMMQQNPDLDGILTDDKSGATSGVPGLLRMANRLRSRNYSIAVSPHKSLRSALLLSLSGIPCRIGFRQSKGWFLFHHRVSRDPRLHDIDRNLSLLEPLGIDPREAGRALRLPVSAEIQARVKKVFHARGLEKKEGKKIFGINPGSVWPTKRWSVAGYAELIVQLKKSFSCDVVLFGGPEDRGTAQRIQTLCGEAAFDLVGCTTLEELPSALGWCDVFVTNDSAPMHVAVGCGVPVVALFCATTPDLGFYPFSSRAVVVQKELSCRPCTSHGGRRCPLGTEACIHSIRTEDVLKAVAHAMNGTRPETTASDDLFIPHFVTL